MKMYILIPEGVESGFAIVGAAHASLACYLKFSEDTNTKEWLSGPFYKTVCRVSQSELEKAKLDCPDFVSITESSLDGIEVAVAFKPLPEFPKGFRFFRLFKWEEKWLIGFTAEERTNISSLKNTTSFAIEKRRGENHTCEAFQVGNEADRVAHTEVVDIA